MEPFFPGAENFAQRLMIIAIMNSLFHNIQYHAIVWFYSRKRYIPSLESDDFGWAKKIHSQFSTYALAAFGFSFLFSFVFWLRADIPFFTGILSAGDAKLFAYVLYFGVVGQHFYLDQKIWKVSRTPELSKYLAIKATFAA